MLKWFPFAAVLFSLAAVAADTPAEVAYPKDYRNWHHVKSMVIGPEHGLYDAFGGIHHIYANPEAMKGYAAGKFPDGAVIVFDLLDVAQAGGATEESVRKVLGVMEKNTKRFPATGGWGFEAFKGDSRTERAITQQSAASACFTCHMPQADTDYVFSRPRP